MPGTLERSRPARSDPAKLAGGRSAIAGFLFQILRSIELGLRVSVIIVAGGANHSRMKLTLEPTTGGDHQLADDNRVVIEQVKMRTLHRSWSSSAVAREVFPDLLKGVQPGTSQVFRFVTNNPKGLGVLKRYLDTHRQRDDQVAPAFRFRWGSEHLSLAQFTARLAVAAGVMPDDPHFQWLLDNLTLEVIDTATVEAEIDALLEPVLAPGQHANDKRHELISRLLEAAREGRSLRHTDLLAMIDPDAYLRLAHARSLPSILSRWLEADCRTLGYDQSQQARLNPLEPVGPLTIISGESGQGKTWSLCQAALAQAARGELAIALSAQNSLDRLIREINERVWLLAYADPVSPQVMARRLARAVKNRDGIWLTVYLDDLQDRSLAEEIARLDWHRHGIRVVVSAQPRIVEAIFRARGDAHIEQIENFTSAELRRYLRHHDREEPLETMPDDVFELLLKPIHAKVFTELPPRSTWTGVTEYELFKSYWDFATSQARAQYDHPHDREGLMTLAGSLLGNRPRYPWRTRDIGAARLDDAAIRRLEVVGLVRWVNIGRLAFASDRMLNWAIAECLCARVVDERWSPTQAGEELERVETIVAAQDEPLGRRLGYVFLDTVWLLTQEVDVELIADVLLAQMRRLAQEWRGEQMWSQHLATTGTRLLPTLENLALRSYDEDQERAIRANIPLALAAIADGDREAVNCVIARLLASDNEGGIEVALNAARRVSTPEVLDTLWCIHIDREAAFDQCGAGPDHRDEWAHLLRRREVSSEAVRRAVTSASDWLNRKIANSQDPIELNHLLWILTDHDYMDDDHAREIWLRHRGHFLRYLSHRSKAMIKALGHFSDVDNRGWLDTVPLEREDWMSFRVLRSRARLDPPTAFQQIRERNEDYGWSAAGWWLPDLARIDPAGLAAAIRENVSKSDSPLTDTILYYSHYPELMDESTLEWVLDEFALELQSFNNSHESNPDSELGRLGHPLRFLPTLTEPWQFQCVARRAGTLLEEALVRFATRRTGRTNRYRDTHGAECERLLAMIDGTGFDALVVTELRRANLFGREDGFSAAHWTESSSVRVALQAAQDNPDPDGYREVIRMQALAVHQCDSELEAMVRAHAPIYVNAAEMRSADGRPTESLHDRVKHLIENGNQEDLRVAAQLAGFLRAPEQVHDLVPAFLDSNTSEIIKHAIIGTFKALGFYNPSILPTARTLLVDRIDNEAQFVASYLASEGDAEARRAVVSWLGGLDLGTWSTSRHAFLHPLLDHDDSRPAVIDFLRRSREGGHVLIESPYIRLLADAGDARARDELIRSAYRGPRFGDQDTSGGIAYLRTLDHDEAFFAARRYLARHGAPAAIDLMLQINAEAAVDVLIDKHGKGKPSLQWEIARRLRSYLSADQTTSLLNRLANSNLARERLLAAQLGGWMPPSIPLAWLEDLANSGSASVRATARTALRRRAREAAAMAHLKAMASSSKPLRWARLQTIFEGVDPHFLWSRDDPASLREMIDFNPPEFLVEALQLRSRRIKNLEDEVKKADREAR